MVKNICVSALLLLLSSCVSVGKFQKVETDNQTIREKNRTLNGENRALKAENTEARAEIEKQNRNIETLKLELESKRSETVGAKEETKKYKDLYDELLKTKMSSGVSSSETRALLKKLRSIEEDLQKRESKLSKAQKELLEKQKKVSLLSRDNIAKNKRLELLESELRKKDAMNQRIKDAIAGALLNFKDKGFNVRIEDGKVYVSLDNKLLFASGSYQLRAEGSTAISQLSKAISSNKDINIMVEGHTDDVPLGGKGALADNWDLSVRRATSVVKILMKDPKISGKQITAAGRSKYKPVAKGKTAAARAKNRRIEIVISPDLDEIYKLVTD